MFAGTARVSEDMVGTGVWKTQVAGTHWVSVGSERRLRKSKAVVLTTTD